MIIELNEVIEIGNNKYIPLVEIDKLKDKRPFLIELKGDINKRIVVVLVDSEIFAIGDVCPHQHKHSLHQGYVENYYLTCPEHGWTFSLRTGENKDKNIGTQKLEIFETKLVRDYVFLRVDNIIKNKWKFI